MEIRRNSDMYKYIISYDGGILRDSSDHDYVYESYEEAKEEASLDKESFIDGWKANGCEYEEELFDIEIDKV